MGARLDEGYYVAEMISDIMSNGGSSRLYQALVKEQQLFSNIECFHFGSVEPDIMDNRRQAGERSKMEDANNAIEAELDKLKNDLVSETELQKVKNKTEASLAFEDMSVGNRTNNLAFYELLGNASLMNEEPDKYRAISSENIRDYSQQIFDKNNSNTLFYYSEN